MKMAVSASTKNPKPKSKKPKAEKSTRSKMTINFKPGQEKLWEEMRDEKERLSGLRGKNLPMPELAQLAWMAYKKDVIEKIAEFVQPVQTKGLQQTISDLRTELKADLKAGMDAMAESMTQLFKSKDN